MTDKPTYHELEQRVRELEIAESERKRTEEDLRESEEKHRILLESAPFGMALIDRRGSFTYVNPKFTEIFGYDLAHVPDGRTWFRKAYPDEEDRRKAISLWIADTKDAKPGELIPRIFSVTCLNGTKRVVNIITSILFSSDYLMTCEDITERKMAEEALRESEQFRGRIIQSLVSGLYIYDLEKFHNDFISDQYTALTGWTLDEINEMEQTFIQLFHPEDRLSVEAHFRKVKKAEDGEVLEIEYRFRTKDGRWIWCISRDTVFERNEQGDVTRFIGSFFDITERKQAEEALVESEFRFRSFVENANDIVYSLNPEGVFTYVSPNWLDAMGEPANEAVGKSFEPYVHAEDVHLCREFLERVLNTGKKQSSVEYRVRHSNGSWRWHLSNGSPMWDKGGNVIGYVGIGRDITERKRMEEDMWQYQNIVASTSDGIALLDKEYRYIIVNDAYERFSGVKREHFIGREVSEYLGQDVFKQFVKPHFDKCLQGDTVVYQEWFEYPSMGRRFVEVTYSPYRDIRNNISGVLSNTRDITERKKAEEEKEKLQAQLAQAQKMESIGTLAGGIAHDFNNILSIIVGNTELGMLDVPEWSPAQDNLKEVREATLRARELVKQILMFARQKEHTVSSIRLEPIAKESIKMLRASIPTTVEILENIEESLPPVLAEPSRIQQIIMNLCTNAGQVMEAEGGTLTFTLDSADLKAPLHTVLEELPPGRYVRMRVRDTGPGIPPEILDRVFDPFFTTKGVGEGTGLGLAVVHGIVQDRKGGIIVESEEGRGTTFSIYLPASEGQSVEVKAEQKTELPRGTERVLFVDDEPMIMKLGQRILERQGYVVETRASGTDGLECFRQDPHRFDLLVTDMTMPGMRGDRLVEEILAIRPDIPVILCTGYSRQISKEKAREIGVRAFVMKPLTQHELASTVRRVLDEKLRK